MARNPKPPPQRAAARRGRPETGQSAGNILDVAERLVQTRGYNGFSYADIAAELVRDGRALAIGEVGRPHFPVSEEQLAASNEVMSYAMSLGREVGCAVVLHTESATPESMRGLAQMADRAGLPRWRLVKHYCPPLVLEEENHGLMPSVLAGRDAVKEALAKGTRFMMETDFLDDPRRPGAVLDIRTVPKRTRTMMGQGLMTEEQAHAIHAENPRRTYGDAFA